MILSHIVAVSKNFVIGADNGLPWKMPSDSKYFHDVTRGHVVIMGRKNYEANGNKALKGRTNIIITNKKDFQLRDSIVMHSPEEAIEFAATLREEEVFIVGGGEIFKQSIDLVDRIYITLIDTFVKGDTYYPQIDFSKWNIVSEIFNKADEKNLFDYTYYILQRPTLK
jgi:dihydrofolate reductase